ncbi:Sialic acid synthase [Dissostichus eleginoides]|uniref:Sialic acid synthase n=1 Tax=Dissostichus eleginoides TaxID=100907 RepID=A0AAD9C0H1_DISEL|nr:Sialic acid synthase [Dissostichus eleginoides]
MWSEWAGEWGLLLLTAGAGGLRQQPAELLVTAQRANGVDSSALLTGESLFYTTTQYSMRSCEGIKCIFNVVPNCVHLSLHPSFCFLLCVSSPPLQPMKTVFATYSVSDKSAHLYSKAGRFV